MNENDLLLDQDDDTPVITLLRKAARDKDKEIAKLAGEISSLKSEKRTGSIADILKAKGVSPKVAALLPAEIEPTADAIGGWLNEWADVFNISTSDAAETPGNGPESHEQGSTVPDDVRAAYEVLRAAEAAGGPVPFLGADKTRAALNDIRGKGSDDAVAKLRELGLAE